MPTLDLSATGGDGRTVYSRSKARTVLFVDAAIHPDRDHLEHHTCPPAIAGVVVLSCMCFAIMYSIAYLVRRDVLDALVFGYLNIGWLGLPIATSLFGATASSIMLAMYVGSLVFGNTVGGIGLQKSKGSAVLVSFVLSPNIIAVAIGLILRGVGAVSPLVQWGYPVYLPSKFMMSMLGMGILGMWLVDARIRCHALYGASVVSGARILVGEALMVGVVLLSRAFSVEAINAHAYVLFMIPLLPPAANIIILETHYADTGRTAAPIVGGTLISLLLLGLYAGGLTY